MLPSPLAVINNASVNIGVHVSVCVLLFNSFGYIPSGGLAGLYGN